MRRRAISLSGVPVPETAQSAVAERPPRRAAISELNIDIDVSAMNAALNAAFEELGRAVAFAGIDRTLKGRP